MDIYTINGYIYILNVILPHVYINDFAINGYLFENDGVLSGILNGFLRS